MCVYALSCYCTNCCLCPDLSVIVQTVVYTLYCLLLYLFSYVLWEQPIECLVGGLCFFKVTSKTELINAKIHNLTLQFSTSIFEEK